MLVLKNGGAGGGCPVEWEKNGIGKHTVIRETGVNKGTGHLGEGRGEGRGVLRAVWRNK